MSGIPMTRVQAVDPINTTRAMSQLHMPKKGIVQVHVVESRHIRRAPSTDQSAFSFSLSLHLGRFSSGGSASQSAASHCLPTARSDDSIAPAEVEMPLSNADHWLWIRATPIAVDANESDDGGVADCAAGEVRLPLKEYERGVFHDCWLTLRRPAATHTAAEDASMTTAYVTGRVHVRFLYQLSSVPTSGPSPDQSCLAQLPSPIGAFVAHLLHSGGFWMQVLLQYLDARTASSSTAGDSAAKARELAGLLQAVLTLLSHARFSLLLGLLDACVRRELSFLAEQQSGRVDSVWASNLFRRNSVAAKLLAMYCLDNAKPTVIGNAQGGTTSTAAREGVGKPYLVQLLSPFVSQVVKDVSGGVGSSGMHTNYFAAESSTQNPYEIDPAKLDGNDTLLRENQARLIGRCQELLDAVLLSNTASEGKEDAEVDLSAPVVPSSLKWVARTLKRCVCEYVAQSLASTPPTSTPSSSIGGHRLVGVPSEGDASDEDGEGASTPSAPVDSSDGADADPDMSLAQIAHESSHNSLASLFFLRFLCPALVTPVHYGLLARPPPPAASRALILLAKALQSLVNSAGSVASTNTPATNTSDAASTGASSIPIPANSPVSVDTDVDASPSEELDGRTPPGRERAMYTQGNSAPAAPPPVPLLSPAQTSSLLPPSAPPPVPLMPASLRNRASTVAMPAASPAATRLFKEPYMEIFYPFITSNLPRVSAFLDALGVLDPTSAEVRPGIEELPVMASTMGDTVVADEAAQARELERAAWLLHQFVKTNLTGICTVAARMMAAAPAGPNSSLALPRAMPGHISGAMAMQELTRPRHSASTTTAYGSQSGTSAGAPSIAASQEHPLITRFRLHVDSMSPPATMQLSDSPAGTPRKPHHSSGSHTSTVSALAAGVAAAPSTGFKFFQRFLPHGKEKEKEKQASSAAASVPPPVLLDTSASSTASASPPPSSPSSTELDDLQLFKQTSVEIQLRLSEQLEESEQRCAALQRAYDELEQQCAEKDQELRMMKRQLERTQIATAAAAELESDDDDDEEDE